MNSYHFVSQTDMRVLMEMSIAVHV